MSKQLDMLREVLLELEGEEGDNPSERLSGILDICTESLDLIEEIETEKAVARMESALDEIEKLDEHTSQLTKI